MEDLISKKELLQATGISYGQLYRWKRKQLIPESWFLRRSTFTGQETFFPRDVILDRVQLILSLKSDTALDALADELRESTARLDWLDLYQQLHPSVPPDESWAEHIAAAGLRLVTCTEFLATELWRSNGQATLPMTAFATWIDRFRDVPVDWLDFPQCALVGWQHDQRWRFAFLQSRENLWDVGGPMPFVVMVAETWTRCKRAWHSLALKL